MALVAISYPIEGLALLGWLAQVLEKVLSESLVELPLQLIGILVFDWQGTASRKAVPPNPHPVFLVCKVIALAKKVDKSTFTSITTPVSDLEVMCEQVGLIVKNLKVLLKRYPPFLPTIPLYQGMTWDPTWKALPTHPLTQRRASYLWRVMAAGYLVASPTVRYVYDKFNDLLSAWDLDWFTIRVHPYLPSPFDYGIPPVTGRLGQTIEGGGKRRIFAMGNYVNLNQRLLKPVHDWLMQVLRRIPMDGTFAFTKLRWNQHKPLDRLVGNQTCYSFDLKSATDRWPVLFLFEVFKVCFGQPFASSVVNSALAFHFCEVPFVKKKDSQVYFRVGQPLGYYSYWPLYALTYHI
ncbi:hypothetical protein HN873_062353 [Arachis hypogaea]